MTRTRGLITVGGVDPSGGAGLLRDAWTHRELDFEGPSWFIPSAWTRQGQGRPAQAAAVPARIFEAQLERCPLAADAVIKLGLLPTQLVPVFAAWLDRRRPDAARWPLIVDPVLRASDGGDLGASATALWEIFERASVVTPNREEWDAIDAARTKAAAVTADGPSYWYIKSAASTEAEIRDRVVDARGDSQWLALPRSAGPDPRGTGCAFASALALAWARRDAAASALPEAWEAARRWLADARTRVVPGPDGRAHMRSLR